MWQKSCLLLNVKIVFIYYYYFFLAYNLAALYHTLVISLLFGLLSASLHPLDDSDVNGVINMCKLYVKRVEQPSPHVNIYINLFLCL